MRVMMNTKLGGTHNCRIIVPIIHQENYLLFLQKQSRNRVPNTLQVMEDLNMFS